MTKSLAKFTSYGEQKKLEKKVKILGRNVRVGSKLKEIDTTGLSYPFSASSNVVIDKQIEGPCGDLSTEELNGIHAFDPINELTFLRINGSWRKLKLE